MVEEDLEFVRDLPLRVMRRLLVLLVCVNKVRAIAVVLVVAVAVVVRAGRVRMIAASATLVLLRRLFLAATLEFLRRLFLAAVTAV